MTRERAFPSSPVPERPSVRRRRRGLHRTTKVVLVVGLVVTTLIVGAQWALHRSYFSVRTVVVHGAIHESLADIVAATGLGEHPPMVDVQTNRVRDDVLRFPWVSAVTVTKRWPSTVIVDVTETTAVAVAPSPAVAGSFDYVSAQGRDLGTAPTNANLPTLRYTAATPAWPFATVAQGAAQVAAQLPTAFSVQVRQISENAHGVISILLTTPVRFLLGSDTNLHAKFVAIASVIDHVTLVPGDVVDVSVPTELAVTPPTSG